MGVAIPIAIGLGSSLLGGIFSHKAQSAAADEREAQFNRERQAYVNRKLSNYALFKGIVDAYAPNVLPAGLTDRYGDPKFWESVYAGGSETPDFHAGQTWQGLGGLFSSIGSNLFASGLGGVSGITGHPSGYVGTGLSSAEGDYLGGTEGWNKLLDELGLVG